MENTDYQARVSEVMATARLSQRFGASVRYMDLELRGKDMEELEMMVWHAVVMTSTPVGRPAPVGRVGAASTRARTALVRKVPLTENQATALRENAIRGRRMPHLAKKGLVRRRESGYTDTPHYDLTLLGKAVQQRVLAEAIGPRRQS